MNETFGPFGHCTTTGKIALTGDDVVVHDQATAGTVNLYSESVAAAMLLLNGGTDVATPVTPRAVHIDLMPLLSGRSRRLVLGMLIDDAAGETAIEDLYAIVPNPFGTTPGKFLQLVGTLTWTAGNVVVPTSAAGNTTRRWASSVSFVSTEFLLKRLGMDVQVSGALASGVNLAEATVPDSPGIEGFIRNIRKGTCVNAIAMAQRWT